ncbi:hypothetical protein [Paenibacillus sp. A3M_27_13]|uniref:hypothetical protein n=1 Tax=Paenibacillus sp. A3M_27_13 TaxID=2962029 RepID=UPI000FA3A8F4|nr:hypothetical protein [Paenibacillus sp. A3M_27_13]MCP3743783.1 hypothetical protein [Paenibacillus sp. A3M_27_13]
MIDGDQISEFETATKYQEAFLSTKSEWDKGKRDLSICLNLGFISWYLSVESGNTFITQGLNDNDYEIIELTLSEVTEEGIRNFSTETQFLLIFGYMITLFPHHFGDYEYWESIGKNMLSKAYELEPSDPIIEMVFLADNMRSEGYRNACLRSKEHIKEHIKDRFKNKGLMDKYFQDVFDR